jgi:hypothetical protein
MLFNFNLIFEVRQAGQEKSEETKLRTFEVCRKLSRIDETGRDGGIGTSIRS